MYINTGYGTIFPNSGTYLVVIIGIQNLHFPLGDPVTVYASMFHIFFNFYYRSLPKKKKNPHLNNTPLARLSPSSEMSHNTPRILTLKDLSGKPLPTSMLLTEQSERSLNSPVSHISSGSRHRLRGGLTSENVARFNNAHRNSPLRSVTPKNSTLVNTLGMYLM